MAFNITSGVSQSQLCSGNFGPPLFSINFGNGDNPGSSITEVSSAYQFASADCPDKGYYTIRNNIVSCFPSRWHRVDFDHTPTDPKGYFLLVNAINGRSEIYNQRISGLCTNTTFQLSTWILNMLKVEACSGTDPDLTFMVTDLSNNLLASYNTGPIAKKSLAVWVPYNFAFKTPAGVSEVMLRIISNTPGCDNEFAIDDIEFRPCLPVIEATISGFAKPNIEICETSLRSFSLLGKFDASLNNASIQWQESDDQGFTWNDIAGGNLDNQTVSPYTVGDHRYRFIIVQSDNMNNLFCLLTSNTISIRISRKPFAQATNYVFGCYGSTIVFGSAGGIQYEWSGPNGFYSNLQNPEIPNVTFAETGLYIVNVTSNNGCISSDSTTLTIYEAPVASISVTDTSVCEGSLLTLTAEGGQNYEWFPTIGLSNDTIPNPVVTVQDSIMYTARVYNEYSCYDTISVRVNVWKKPKAVAGPDKLTIKNKSIQLDGEAVGTGVSYFWSPPDHLDNPLLERPNASPRETQIYMMTVVSDMGCGRSTDEMKVEVVNKLFIPNAFTPNGDGLNDRWAIILFEEYPKGVVNVFNRYGQLVYRSYASGYKSWDGKFNGAIALSGTYVYFVHLGNGSPLLKGTVTVVY